MHMSLKNFSAAAHSKLPKITEKGIQAEPSGQACIPFFPFYIFHETAALDSAQKKCWPGCADGEELKNNHQFPIGLMQHSISFVRHQGQAALRRLVCLPLALNLRTIRRHKILDSISCNGK